ncbi:hypothetical protein Tco_1545500 [Tanacetum coccineum]
MGSGNQEVNVLSKPKKVVVLKKPRSLSVADNIVEEIVVVKLAKSTSIEEQRLQQRHIMTQLTIERQVKKYVEDTYAAETGLKLKDTDKDDDEDDTEDSDMDISVDDDKRDDDDATGFGVFIYNKS